MMLDKPEVTVTEMVKEWSDSGCTMKMYKPQQIYYYKSSVTPKLLCILCYTHTPPQTLLGNFLTEPTEINLWSLSFLPSSFSNVRTLPLLTKALCTLHMLNSVFHSISGSTETDQTKPS